MNIYDSISEVIVIVVVVTVCPAGWYRRVLVPAPSNLNLLAFYRPGRHPSLDEALIRHSLPPPFLVSMCVCVCVCEEV